MANIKTGMAYYNIDTDRYQDMRIKRLKKNFGCSGIAIYDYILCEIYRVRGCFIEWDESTAFDVAEYFNLKETLVSEIVNYCCSVGLFNKELLACGRVLTSESIQKRYIEMCVRAKRKDITIPEQCKIIHEQSNIITEECKIVTAVCDKVKESKEEEKKEKEEKKDFFLIEKEKFLNDTIWLSEFGSRKYVSPEKLKNLMAEFLTDLELREEFKPEKELKNHFTNWFNKKNQNGTINHSAGNRANRQQDGISCAFADLEKLG